VNGDTERRAWFEILAGRVEALGLSPVVLPFLEVIRAFGPLGSQALLMAQPLMTGIFNDTTIERTAALLDSPELLEQFKTRLEHLELEKETG
jgi:hypothetical protein